jgi:hypothetical protein
VHWEVVFHHHPVNSLSLLSSFANRVKGSCNQKGLHIELDTVAYPGFFLGGGLHQEFVFSPSVGHVSLLSFMKDRGMNVIAREKSGISS